MDQIALDSTALEELNSVETRTLFDTIDNLSMLGVGRIVNLPQIIVVGDQSSGKSSVLEAISHVHFPVHGGVCTRFATELVLRPGSRRRVIATVLFADNTKPAHELQVTDFNQDDIDNIISNAKHHMGLSDIDGNFSKDVLRLEIEGPGLYPLTLVDLPGIFHTATATQSEEGRETVMELVRSYMKKQNSIILAIVSANNQLANQAVLQVAANFDPAKKRTLGVITKPDHLHPGSSNERDYIQIIRGRETRHNLLLGWHVLRNQADYEKSVGTRDEVEEQFLNSGAWASIPRANRGVAALRKKLSQILLSHFKQNLPTVIDDIQIKLRVREGELKRLGQPRSTPADMRAYLIDVAGSFQKLVRDGIEGHYKDPFFGGLEGTQRKFRSQLRNFNRAIRHVLLAQGATQKIIQSFGEIRRQHTIPDYLQGFINAHQYNLRTPEVITWVELAAQLERQAADNQGTEFPGYANMDLMIQLFQKQSEPWAYIAEKHVGHVTIASKAFVDQIFEHVIGSASKNSTTDAILSTCVDSFFDAKDEILAAKVQEVLRPFKQGYAMPLDVDFQEAMENRIAERTASQAEWVDNTSFSPPRISEPQSSREFATDRIIDTMQTFYDMALRTFTDNLVNLVIESCLIRELPSILTPRDVNLMSEARLAELAAESEEVRQYRSQLQQDIKLLEKGLEQCRRYKPRTAEVHCPSPSRTSRGSPEQHRNTTVPDNASNKPTSTTSETRGNTASTSVPGSTTSKEQQPVLATGQRDRVAKSSTNTPSKVSISNGSSESASSKADTSPKTNVSKTNHSSGKTGLFGSTYIPMGTANGPSSSIFAKAAEKPAASATPFGSFLSSKTNPSANSASTTAQSGGILFGTREPISSTAAGSNSTNSSGLKSSIDSSSWLGNGGASTSLGGGFGGFGSLSLTSSPATVGITKQSGSTLEKPAASSP